MLRAMTSVCGNVDALSTLLSLVNEPAILIDRAGLITGWSQGAEILFGHSPADALGRQSADLYAADEREAHRNRCQSVLAGGQSADFEATIAMKSGELLAARVELLPMRGADGLPQALLSRVRTTGNYSMRPDVSHQQMQGLMRMIDRAPIAFSLLDANRRFVYANQACLKLLPTSMSNLVGRHVRDVLGEKRYEVVLPQIDEVLQGKESDTEVDTIDADGERLHLYRHVYPDIAEDGSVVGYFSAILDITKTKISQEHQLRREHMLRATLVREINHRIKNSLQGIIGMMRFHTAQKKMPMAMLIEQCVSQLMAVGVAFGLASRHGEAQILLCDMMLEIAHNVEQVSQRRIHVDLSSAAVRRPVALSEGHGTNISLVVNELIFNALKHSATLAGPRNITVRVDRDDHSATVAVTNEAGVLPPGFSLQSGRGLGTGLTLIKALIPPDSCELAISQEDKGVTARLTLRSPVLSLT